MVRVHFETRVAAFVLVIAFINSVHYVIEVGAAHAKKSNKPE